MCTQVEAVAKTNDLKNLQKNTKLYKISQPSFKLDNFLNFLNLLW